jgi:general L-amino acid transport system permease protein
MLLAFPLGVALAFGRQARLPVLRLLAIAFIEGVRGVPLVSLLFLAFVTVPLFLPEGLRLPQVVRALVAFTLFAAAYLAENVRGGLQAVPKGQWEAAFSLGLTPFQAVRYVILPQALRAVVPALVGQVAIFVGFSSAAQSGPMSR